MLDFIKKKYPFLFFIIFFLVFFRKVIFSGLMPIPSDLLVSFYFPFSSGGFKEYSPWVPNKAQVLDDALRQQYPWKLFASEQIKKGELPLWNPYAFSGYPIYANVQTAIFYPLNLLFVVLNPKTSWTILILLQPVLSVLFMFLFLRSLKLSKLSSIFGGLVFAFMSFELFWMEQMIIGHTTLWLPLILIAIQKISEGKKKWFGIGIPAITLSILGGYSQTTLYVLIISVFFLLIKVFQEKNIKNRLSLFITGTSMFILAIGISSIQLMPTLEIYKNSAREGVFSESLYEKSLAPPRNILTLLSSDFFGNKATHNYWGDEYTDFNHWFGCIPLAILLTGLYLWYKKKIDFGIGKWFFILGITAWLFSLTTPFGYIPLIFKIPILSTGVVARFLFIFQFGMVIASAISLDQILKQKDLRIPLKPAFFLFFLTLVLTTVFYLISKYSNNKDLITVTKVSFRNLALSAIIFGTGFGVLFLTKIKKIRSYCLFFLLIITAFEFIYLGNKYLPISKKEYLFPSHPLFTFLQQKKGIDRVWGQETTYLTTNFPTVYSLHYSDGYDSLFIKKYGEFVYSSRNGKIPNAIPRSDVNFNPNKENWQYKERMMDVLGIKYVLDKNDIPKLNFEPETWKFSKDRYKLIWQNGKFKVYENLKAWPRIYFAKKIIKKDSDQEIINSLFLEKENNLAVVEEVISDKSSISSEGSIKLVKYSPNKIDIETKSLNKTFLVLTDNYYPGWIAKIDGSNTKIYRTNYTFRGIIIPKGDHKIEFSYEPKSLKIGFIISMIFVFLSIISYLFYAKNKTDYK